MLEGSPGLVAGLEYEDLLRVADSHHCFGFFLSGLDLLFRPAQDSFVPWSAQVPAFQIRSARCVVVGGWLLDTGLGQSAECDLVGLDHLGLVLLAIVQLAAVRLGFGELEVVELATVQLALDRPAFDQLEVDQLELAGLVVDHFDLEQLDDDSLFQQHDLGIGSRKVLDIWPREGWLAVQLPDDENFSHYARL